MDPQKILMRNEELFFRENNITSFSLFEVAFSGKKGTPFAGFKFSLQIYKLDFFR